MKLNITKPYLLLLLLPLVLGGLGGCTGVNSFTTAARPGETIALAVGYRQHLQRKNMTITITDSSNATITYQPNDLSVRGVLNLYPDPISKLRVSNDIGENVNGAVGSFSGQTQQIEITNYPGTGTSGDSDWWLTTVLLDLPKITTLMSNGLPIATGPAKISIADAGGAVIHWASVEILPGSSLPNSFTFWQGYQDTTLNAGASLIKNLERADHYVVTFQSATIPHSIQAVFTHTLGAATVINQRGEMKNILWSDDGAGNLKVMITPPDGYTLVDMRDLKFYIAGNITNVALNPTSLKAYDITGAPISGVTATVTAQ